MLYFLFNIFVLNVVLNVLLNVLFGIAPPHAHYPFLFPTFLFPLSQKVR